MISCWFQICLRYDSGQFSPMRCCETIRERKHAFHMVVTAIRHMVLFFICFFEDHLFRSECIFMFCPFYSLSVSGVMFEVSVRESLCYCTLHEHLMKCCFF